MCSEDPKCSFCYAINTRSRQAEMIRRRTEEVRIREEREERNWVRRAAEEQEKARKRDAESLISTASWESLISTASWESAEAEEDQVSPSTSASVRQSAPPQQPPLRGGPPPATRQVVNGAGQRYSANHDGIWQRSPYGPPDTTPLGQPRVKRSPLGLPVEARSAMGVPLHGPNGEPLYERG